MESPTDSLPAQSLAVHEPSAFRDAPSQARFWGAAIGLTALDLWTKQWAFRSLGVEEARTIVPSLLEFRRSLNDGAVFGSFTGYVGLFVAASVVAALFVVYLFVHSPRSSRWLQLCLGMILAGAIGNLYDRIFMQADVLHFARDNGKPWSIIGRVVSPAGDPLVVLETWPEGGDPRRFSAEQVRIRRQGVVRDFIKFTPRFPSWTPVVGGKEVWPWVFNVADASLVCGVGLLLLASLLDRPRPPSS
jgi:lipoprotein signal peptidase